MVAHFPIDLLAVVHNALDFLPMLFTRQLDAVFINQNIGFVAEKAVVFRFPHPLFKVREPCFAAEQVFDPLAKSLQAADALG